jgi:hypothetical protein
VYKFHTAVRSDESDVHGSFSPLKAFSKDLPRVGPAEKKGAETKCEDTLTFTKIKGLLTDVTLASGSKDCKTLEKAPRCDLAGSLS